MMGMLEFKIFALGKGGIIKQEVSPEDHKLSHVLLPQNLLITARKT